MGDNTFHIDGAVPSATLPGQRPLTAHAARPALLTTVTAVDLTDAIVGLSGELDLAVVNAVTEVLDAQLDAGRRHVLLDVSELAFCTCAGLGCLMASRHRLAAVGGTLTLTGLNDSLRRLLQLTDLIQSFATPQPVAVQNSRECW